MIKLQTCSGKKEDYILTYKDVIHVSPHAIVFAAEATQHSQTPKRVAVKWTLKVAEPENHCKAFRLVSEKYRGVVVPLLGYKTGRLQLSTIFNDMTPTLIQKVISKWGRGNLIQVDKEGRMVTNQNSTAVLVMPRYSGSAQDLMDRDPKGVLDYHDYMKICSMSEKVFLSMEDRNLVHGKPEPSNVLYRGGGQGRSFVMTDFSHLRSRPNAVRDKTGKAEIRLLHNKLKVEEW